MKALVGLGILVTSVGAFAQPAPTTTTNKQLIIEFFGVTGTRQERADTFLALD